MLIKNILLISILLFGFNSYADLSDLIILQDEAHYSAKEKFYAEKLADYLEEGYTGMCYSGKAPLVLSHIMKWHLGEQFYPAAGGGYALQSIAMDMGEVNNYYDDKLIISLISEVTNEVNEDIIVKKCNHDETVE